MNTLASTPRRGQEWRIRYLIDEQTHTVAVLDVGHRSVTYGT
jgi:mRNA-degrading endonuclease RelE of RelBE toxin-antitoxin system